MTMVTRPAPILFDIPVSESPPGIFFRKGVRVSDQEETTVAWRVEEDGTRVIMGVVCSCYIDETTGVRIKIEPLDQETLNDLQASLQTW